MQTFEDLRGVNFPRAHACKSDGTCGRSRCTTIAPSTSELVLADKIKEMMVEEAPEEWHLFAIPDFHAILDHNLAPEWVRMREFATWFT